MWEVGREKLRGREKGEWCRQRMGKRPGEGETWGAKNHGTET